MKRVVTGFGVVVAVVALVLVRYYEEFLFYDPLLPFFEGLYLNAEKLPVIHPAKLLLSVSLRYWLNSALSVLILVLLFRSSEIYKLALLIYSCAFLILIAVFTAMLCNYSSGLSMLLFYVRRFLIQPVLILILIPAFYYQRIQSKK